MTQRINASRRMMLALAACILSLAAGATSLQAQCCDYVVQVHPGVLCPIRVDAAFYDNAGAIVDGKFYLPGAPDYVNTVPCPNRLQSIAITVGNISVLVPYGADHMRFEISPGCCVFISINNNWPPAPCYVIVVEPAPC